MNIEKIKSDISKLIDRADKVSSRPLSSPNRQADQVAVRISMLSYLKNLLSTDHLYYKEFKEKTISGSYTRIDIGASILRALKEDIDENWLFNLKQLVASELFSDYLEIAEHLLEEGYKDAAAVMTGSTLESHLKLLCLKNEIEITFINPIDQEKPKKADTINSDLRKAEVYNILEQKQITAWLDLRNKAAHGEYDQYNTDDVKLMYSGVLSFITKTTI
jgi:hypothetical protein